MNYFDDKMRYNSIYETDYLKNLPNIDYTKSCDGTLKADLNKYQYSYEPTLVEMALNKKVCHDEDYVRNKL